MNWPSRVLEFSERSAGGRKTGTVRGRPRPCPASAATRRAQRGAAERRRSDSSFHLPREEHEELLRRVHHWLAPGGHLLATVTRAREDAYTEDGFFGVRMYWSNWGRDDYERMLRELGFELLATRTLGHGYGDSEARRPESHPLLFARKRR